jgi:DNA gyrase subunit A
MGRVSQGIQALKVGGRERIVGCIAANSTDDLLLVSRQGYAKRIPISNIRIVQTGNMGTHAMQFALKTDSLLHLSLPPANLDLVTTSHRHQLISIDRVQVYGKDGIGDMLLTLNSEEELMFVN